MIITYVCDMLVIFCLKKVLLAFLWDLRQSRVLIALNYYSADGEYVMILIIINLIFIWLSN